MATEVGRLESGCADPTHQAGGGAAVKLFMAMIIFSGDLT
ncbi:unnamed protein product [marine sediment metagenome]|uniref:Uncharacterized protein n=1 Tax=marine sediment metagenome TaxID=412755 RepID=X1BAL9_9ZZZZ